MDCTLLPLATSNRSPSSLSCHTLTDRSHPATPSLTVSILPHPH